MTSDRKETPIEKLSRLKEAFEQEAARCAGYALELSDVMADIRAGAQDASCKSAKHNYVFLIDGSGSMTSARPAEMSPLKSSLDAAFATSKWAEQRSSTAVSAHLWGGADPVKVILSGDMKLYERGLDCGTDFQPLIKALPDIANGKRNTHYILVSDGDVFDLPLEGAKLLSGFLNAHPKVTLDVVVIRMGNHNVVTQMEALMNQVSTVGREPLRLHFAKYPSDVPEVVKQVVNGRGDADKSYKRSKTPKAPS